MVDDQNGPSFATPKRPRPLGFHAKAKPPRDLGSVISTPYGFRTASLADSSGSSPPTFPRSSPFASLNNQRPPRKPTVLSKARVASPPIKAKIAGRKSRSSRRSSQTSFRKCMKMNGGSISSPRIPLADDAPPVPSLPTFLLNSHAPHYPSLLETAHSLEALSQSNTSQFFGHGPTIEDSALRSNSEGSDNISELRLASGSSSSTIKLDAFSSQIDRFPSLLRSGTMLQGLMEEPSRFSETSLTTEQLRIMSFGSVKPRSDCRASIATSTAAHEAQNVTASQSYNSEYDIGDLSLLLDDSPSFLAMTKSNTLALSTSTQCNYAEDKHQRLLAAILEIVPSANEQPPPNSEPTNELQQELPQPTAASVFPMEVPQIVVTKPEDDERKVLPSSSSFSIIDLYIGELESTVSVPRKNGFRLNKDQAAAILRQTFNRKSLRNSASFPAVSSNHGLLNSTATYQATSRKSDHRRGSFLSPGLPSSFLSMSAINENSGNDVKRRSVYSSGLKGLFRRSSSKGSLVLSGGMNSGDANENLARRGSAALSASHMEEGLRSSRLSSWGIFKWIKG